MSSPSPPPYCLRNTQLTPETDPKSLQGHLLLHKTTFCAASNGPTSTLLLPRTTQTSDAPPNTHVLL
ncbi:hypothetical protein IMZ48_01335, partial [Candidatus Bathyarchaeota archaeon]|nr:hypothetical protein [Candidatus Bathyarchaeota archaeon]